MLIVIIFGIVTDTLNFFDNLIHLSCHKNMHLIGIIAFNEVGIPSETLEVGCEFLM
ncbi:Uncharacterised protein [Mycobacteroides abscessus subsp. abscessus]|nr:Uncharacterised protein [Mycobacteroides abscessus subsp. abscessus]